MISDPAQLAERQEDFSSALFIGIDKKVSGRLTGSSTPSSRPRRCWSLLGTIFGIMETFNALAAGGVDGISGGQPRLHRNRADRHRHRNRDRHLLALLGNNVLSRRAHVLTEDFKALLLSTLPPAAESHRA